MHVELEFWKVLTLFKKCLWPAGLLDHPTLRPGRLQADTEEDVSPRPVRAPFSASSWGHAGTQQAGLVPPAGTLSLLGMRPKKLVLSLL